MSEVETSSVVCLTWKLLVRQTTRIFVNMEESVSILLFKGAPPSLQTACFESFESFVMVILSIRYRCKSKGIILNVLSSSGSSCLKNNLTSIFEHLTEVK